MPKSKPTWNLKHKLTKKEIKLFNRGFTIIELLVVIIIIAILVALAISQLNNATKKARDSKRKSDVDLIRVTFQIIHQDPLEGLRYPECSNGQGNNGCTLQDGTETNPKLSDLVKSVPRDPNTNIGYQYYPIPSRPSQCNNASQNPCTAFYLVACLENAKDPGAVADSTECPQTGYKYVITNY